MAERIACIDFSKTPKDFRPIALEPGYPLLDRSNANARIVSKWLGRLAAEPERRGEVVSWYIRSEQGARLDGVRVCPISPQDLKGRLKNELKELQQRLDAVQPKTRAEQAVYRTLKDNLAHLTQQIHRPDIDSDFLKYQDEQGKWRLLWMWGFERVESSQNPAAICIQNDCRALFVNTVEANGHCPHCKTALPISPNPWKRLAIAAAVFLVLAGAGFGGWWSMQPRAAIKGVVLWSGNNHPVKNAEVRLPALDLTTQTDESGQFQFHRLPEGEAQVEVAAAGFHPKSQTETLTVGEETSLKILLEGNASLAGRVVNGVSQVPLDDAEIQIAGTEIKRLSDDEGRFRIESLPSGPQTIHIKAAGFPEIDQTLELTAENTTAVTVPLTGKGILSGFVLQANNKQPISGAKAEVVGTGQTAESDGEGVFVIRELPTGNAQLEISAPGFASHRMNLVVDVKERPQRILLLGAGILSGTITAASDNKPIAGATVQVDGTGLSAISNQSGQFSLPSIPAGAVKVVVSASGYQTEKFDQFIESGRQTLLDAKLAGGAVLAGTVLDGTTGKALPNAEVKISAYTKPLRTDEAGAFLVEGVKAGPARIEADAPGFQSATIAKTLAPGKETKVEIKLLGDAKLRGILTDGLTGKPIADAELKIVDTVLAGKTGADGRFEIAGARSGPAKIEVSASGYPAASFAQSLSSGQITEPKSPWTLLGNSVLTGTVTDLAKKAPVANAVATIHGTKVSVKTDDQGKFRLEKLPARPVMLEISAAGYNPQTVEQDIAPNKPAEIKVLLGGDAVLIGEVLDAVTKKPIPDVKIGIVGYSLAARTDAKGQFRLENAFQGETEVSITSPDYPAQTETVQLESQQETKLAVSLTGTAIAKGMVLSETGDPIAGAVIKRPGSDHQAQTDESGAYELGKLPGGEIRLEVSAKHYKSQTLAGKLTSEKATSLSAAKLKSSLNLAGKVVGALDAKGLPGVTLKIEGTEITGTSNAEGEFALASVPVRPFTLKLEAPNSYPESLEVDATRGEEIKPVLTPVLKPGEARIVLVWGGEITDLDLHLYGPDGHVWFKNRQTPHARLDVDNRNGFGPETITMKTPPPGLYLIWVQAHKDPRNGQSNLNQSDAEVRIYQAGKKAGVIIPVSQGPDADFPVWNPGAIEVPAKGDPILHRYTRLNYKDKLPETN